MKRYSLLPVVVLALLTVLALGAAVLALSEAPATSDLTVHNGAGETLATPSLSALYSSSSPVETVRVDLLGPDLLKETLLKGGPVKTLTIKGSRSQEVLGPFSALLKITGFSARGSTYVATEPASTLVPPDEASQVTGSIRYTATVSGGYLVDLVEHYTVKTPGGPESGTYHYRITDLGGQRTPFP